MNEPTTYLKRLGIDKSDKWLEDGGELVRSFIAENDDVWDEIGVRFLIEGAPQAVLPIFSSRTLTEAMGKICALYLHLGYYRGLMEGEARGLRNQQLEGLAGGEGQ